MAQKTWIFKLDDGNHIVELEHGYFSGKRDIRIDGNPMEIPSKFFDTGSVHKFEISGIPCVLQIKGSLFGFKYSFSVNGKVIDPSSLS
jgi:hypothetical protein